MCYQLIRLRPGLQGDHTYRHPRRQRSRDGGAALSSRLVAVQVLTLNYYGPDRYDFGAGWGRKGSEFVLPVSPQVAVCTQVGSNNRGPRKMTLQQTQGIQRFIAERALRWIIARPGAGLMGTIGQAPNSRCRGICDRAGSLAAVAPASHRIGKGIPAPETGLKSVRVSSQAVREIQGDGMLPLPPPSGRGGLTAPWRGRGARRASCRRPLDPSRRSRCTARTRCESRARPCPSRPSRAPRRAPCS